MRIMVWTGRSLIHRQLQGGYILLPVVLAILLVATLAFMLNQQSSMGLASVTTGVQAEKVQQMAESGLAHALWGAQNSECAGDLSMGNVPFGAGSYSASVDSAATTTVHPPFLPDRDAYIDESNPDANNGTASTLKVDATPSASKRALYYFDLSSIAAGARVTSATAWFYVTVNDPQIPINIHPIISPWTEDDATWNSLSNRFDNAIFGVFSAQPAAGGWISVNLTALAQSWVNDANANNGIMLISPAAGVLSEYSGKEFATASLRPYLQVTTAIGAVSPLSVTATGTLAGTGTPPADISRTLTRNGVGAYQRSNTVNLLPDIDTYIYMWAATWNYGINQKLWADNRAADSIAKSLLKFDLSTLPKGAKVQSAVLELYQTNPSLNGGPVGIHRVTASWLEGTQNAGAGQANWTDRNPGTSWANAGGDYDPAAIATTDVPAELGWSSWDLTDLVNGWVSGNLDNDGLALVAEAFGAAAHFASSDNADATLRPKLRLTFACECGSACMAPQATGRVILLVSDAGALSDTEEMKKEQFEAWGYTVDLLNENSGQTAYNNKLLNNDAVFIPASANAFAIGTKLDNIAIGIVSEIGDMNAILGFATGSANPVGGAVTVTDTSHYITRPFPAGALDIYSANTEGLAVAGTPAAGLQTLAVWGSAGALVTLDTGAVLGGTYSGTNAIGRRAMLPLGRDGSFDWDYLNNNGLLMVQRTLQWASGGSEPPALIYRDEFTNRNCDAADYSGSDGDLDWSPWSWVEGSDDGDPCLSAVEIVEDPVVIEPGNYRLQLKHADNSISRTVDLSAFASAWLSFDYRRDNLANGHEIHVEFWDDANSSWIELDRLLGPADDAIYHQASYDVSAYISANSAVRYTTVGMAATNIFYLDNVEFSETGSGISCDANYSPSSIVSEFSTAGYSQRLNRGVTYLPPGQILNGVTSPPGGAWVAVGGSGILWMVGMDGTELDGGYATGLSQLEGIAFVPATNPIQPGHLAIVKGSSLYYSDMASPAGGYTTHALPFVSSAGGITYIDGGTYDGNLAVADKGSGQVHIIDQSFNLLVTLASGGLLSAPEGIAHLKNTDQFLVVDTGLHRALILDTSLVVSHNYDLVPFNLGAAAGAAAAIHPTTCDHVFGDRPNNRYAYLNAAGGGGGAATSVLLVVGNATSLTQADEDRWNMMFDWGYKVTLFDDSESQSLFDAEVAANDVIFVTHSVAGGTLADKLTGAGKGIVNEFPGKLDNFGFSSGTGQAYTSTGFSSTNPTHYITSLYSGAPVTTFASPMLMPVPSGTLASSLQNLGTPNGAPGDQDAPPAGLAALDTGALRWDGRESPARRVHLPLGLATASQITADGQEIIKRSLAWAGGEGASACNGTFRDEFNTRSYANSDGTLAWATDWLEVGESDGPTSGDEGVGNDQSNYQLRIRDNDNGGEGVEREADLSGALTATLTFDYRRNGLDNSDDYVAVFASATGTGGPYTELPTPRIQGAGSDSSYQSYSRDISDFISAHTAIRLRSSPNMGLQDHVWFDNIQIECSP